MQNQNQVFINVRKEEILSSKKEIQKRITINHRETALDTQKHQ